jgi:hypothetical protein
MYVQQVGECLCWLLKLLVASESIFYI